MRGDGAQGWDGRTGPGGRERVDTSCSITRHWMGHIISPEKRAFPCSVNRALRVQPAHPKGNQS